VTLRDAIQRFRALDEATTSGSVATTIGGGKPLRGATDTSDLGWLTDRGNPFYGRRGLKALEKERQARMKRSKNKCKGYDPACRDKEWEVPAPVGGVALLRRSRVGER
jgi:hypothetical protein